MSKPVITVAVRDLVEFSLRTGDLGGDRGFVGPRRALEGTRGHQRLQRSRPPGYEKEVPLSRDLITEECTLRIQGRIDGLLVSDAEVLLEEIKTIQGTQAAVADPLHWAQVKIYGAMFTAEHSLGEITLRLTYLHLDSGEITEHSERFSSAELADFFNQATSIYLAWIRERLDWCQQRDRSIKSLLFPFPKYRLGQREFAVAVYRAVSKRNRLFVEAPTGIGKTVSALFPALKAMTNGALERIFYLTARTTARAVAEKALRDLRGAGVRLRTLTLTAREKLCVREGQPCDLQTCPLARGYFDRCKRAMRAALAREEITRPILERSAVEHQVCPFELSLDLSSWVDVVICDYNYVFDPKVYLRRHFGDEPRDYVFLVDEAHNLVDRARDMFSAELDSFELRQVSRAVREQIPSCAKALNKLRTALRHLAMPGAVADDPVEPTPLADGTDLFANVQNVPERGGRGSLFPADPASGQTGAEPRTLLEFPAELGPLLQNVLEAAEVWLVRNELTEWRNDLLELYFRLVGFARTAERFDERYRTILQMTGKSARIKLFCLDPSFQLSQALARGKAAVFFSATLTPLDYYRELLGGRVEDPVLQLPSPFPPENLAVLVQDQIGTYLKQRGATVRAVGQAIGALVQERSGNYLVYLPSYQYLQDLKAAFEELYPSVPILAQHALMTDLDRARFLEAFTADRTYTQIGFAVLGGAFGEGIDLVGDRLIGAVVVGVGLPPLSVERDLIRDYFQGMNREGFDYAYLFPGMNRVLQATGRVIRSETDRGAVLLIDTRFGQLRYRRLFPEWWRPVRVRSRGDIGNALSQFWTADPSL